jgi:hypothetical protein
MLGTRRGEKGFWLEWTICLAQSSVEVMSPAMFLSRLLQPFWHNYFASGTLIGAIFLLTSRVVKLLQADVHSTGYSRRFFTLTWSVYVKFGPNERYNFEIWKCHPLTKQLPYFMSELEPKGLTVKLEMLWNHSTSTTYNREKAFRTVFAMQWTFQLSSQIKNAGYINAILDIILVIICRIQRSGGSLVVVTLSDAEDQIR